MARAKQLTNIADVDAKFHHIVKEIIGSRGRISGPFSSIIKEYSFHLKKCPKSYTSLTCGRREGYASYQFCLV